MIHHIKRATRHLIFWSLLALAVGLTAVRVLLLEVDHYKAYLATQVSALVGAEVHIGRLRATLRGFHPEVVLKDIRILSPVANTQPSIQLKEIRLGINLLDALISSNSLASSRVALVGAKLTVKRKPDGSIAIVGLKSGEGQPLWLLQGGQYELLQSEISWQDELHPNSPTLTGMVDAAIINHGARHRINLIMQLPPDLGGRLQLLMDMHGSLFEPAAINGKMYLDVSQLAVQKWLATGLPLAMSVKSGYANAKLWAELQQSQLVALTGDVQLQNLQVLRPERGSFTAKHLDSLFFWQQTQGHWRLDVPRLGLETPGKNWPVNAFSAAGDFTPDHALAKLAVSAASVDLQAAAELGQFFAPLSPSTANWLKEAKPQGTLTDITAFADLNAAQYTVNGKFNHLTIAATTSTPGIDNLSGFVNGNGQQGQLGFKTENAKLNALGLFRNTLDISQLNGTLTWQQTDAEWLIDSPKLTVNSPDLNTTSKLALRLPKTAGVAPFLDLQMAYTMADMTKIPLYLPARIMGKNLVAWADRAFISGSIPKGGLLFYGKLDEFPFNQGQGVFEARFDVDNMYMSYNPEWPHLVATGGEVVFYKDGMDIAIRTGSSEKVTIQNAKITIPMLDKSTQLLVTGKVSTGIHEGLAFMQKSPIHAPVNKTLAAITPQGQTEVTLDLKLPLVTGAPTKVDGFITLDNAQLKVKALDLDVSHINGLLSFDEHGIFSETIKAQTLGHPIQINIKGEHLTTDVYVQGRVGIKELRQQFMLPGWQIADGATDYKIKLHLPSDDRNPELQLQSSLQGVGLELPGSLAKTRSQQRPMSMLFDLGQAQLLPIELSYDNQLKAALRFNIADRTLTAGQVLIGQGTVIKSQQPGITLTINRDRLALQDWLGLGSSLLQEQTEANAADPHGIRAINVHTAHGLWKDTDLGGVDVHIKPEGRFWAGDINAALAKGEFKVPRNLNSKDSIKLTMDSIDLTALKEFKNQRSVLKTAAAPQVLPLISINSKITLWQTVNLGALSVETTRTANGISFNKLALTGGAANLTMTGDWLVKGQHSQSHAVGRIDIAHAGQWLNQLGITKNITETSAKIDFSGAWDGAPYQFSMADWRGKINVNLKDGRILGIEPGFGRVLGIVAVAQWLKRLQLDFSDVYQEGLTFNTIKGAFTVADGKAVTDNLVIDAIPAKITLKGTTDLANKTVDYRVSVVPKSADAVPIAGTIMGKVADLIGQTLTGKDQQGLFFGSEYWVKGDWGDAEFIPLHENDGLLQKTWHGITDFPWLQQHQEP